VQRDVARLRSMRDPPKAL
jgi:hypothetical protein